MNQRHRPLCQPQLAGQRSSCTEFEKVSKKGEEITYLIFFPFPAGFPAVPTPFPPFPAPFAAFDPFDIVAPGSGAPSRGSSVVGSVAIGRFVFDRGAAECVVAVVAVEDERGAGTLPLRVMRGGMSFDRVLTILNVLVGLVVLVVVCSERECGNVGGQRMWRVPNCLKKKKVSCWYIGYIIET